MRLLSAAQCLGYVAFILGVAAFVQKLDRRLKVLIACESLVYALHFALLGNLAASITALISGCRSLLSLKTRSLMLAVLVIAVNFAAAATFAKSGMQWLPAVASCAATVAMFKMQGLALRLVLLTSTLLWLLNNIVSGSIGGTLLELVIAFVNLSTIIRLLRPSEDDRLIPAAESFRAD